MTKLTAERALIRNAIRFANWAAGEGLCPADDQGVPAPEDFLFAYSTATGDEEWDTLADRIADRLALSQEKNDD